MTLDPTVVTDEWWVDIGSNKSSRIGLSGVDLVSIEAPGLSSPNPPGLPRLTAGAGYAKSIPASYSISSTSN
ncbi:hypothetical protein GG344DRAFT_84513 [Lentinula edodes]|nr:hypothetical protein GG344DRAFT_84513 [Lentinula edodes]